MDVISGGLIAVIVIAFFLLIVMAKTAVVVRDGQKLSARPLARLSSTFDQSTG